MSLSISFILPNFIRSRKFEERTGDLEKIENMKKQIAYELIAKKNLANIEYFEGEIARVNRKNEELQDELKTLHTYLRNHDISKANQKHEEELKAERNKRLELEQLYGKNESSATETKIINTILQDTCSIQTKDAFKNIDLSSFQNEFKLKYINKFILDILSENAKLRADLSTNIASHRNYFLDFNAYDPNLKKAKTPTKEFPNDSKYGNISTIESSHLNSLSSFQQKPSLRETRNLRVTDSSLNPSSLSSNPNMKTKDSNALHPLPPHSLTARTQPSPHPTPAAHTHDEPITLQHLSKSPSQPLRNIQKSPHLLDSINSQTEIQIIQPPQLRVEEKRLGPSIFILQKQLESLEEKVNDLDKNRSKRDAGKTSRRESRSKSRGKGRPSGKLKEKERFNAVFSRSSKTNKGKDMKDVKDVKEKWRTLQRMKKEREEKEKEKEKMSLRKQQVEQVKRLFSASKEPRDLKRRNVVNSPPNPKGKPIKKKSIPIKPHLQTNRSVYTKTK